MANKSAQAVRGRPFISQQAMNLLYFFREFVRLEVSGGIVLMAAALVALAWANSPWAESYYALWHTPVAVQLGGFTLDHDLHWWINDALMVVFFFVVGLEIKREVMVGELSSPRQAALPVAAALGGMLLPAVIYAAINWGKPGIHGWGVPMATDIAFALGVMALLGKRIPLALKVFLTALAIVDDIGGVLVIALFYTSQIAWQFLGLAGVIFLVLILVNFSGVRKPLVYAILGILLWLAFLESGLHATLAGILLAFSVPAAGQIRGREFLEQARRYLREFEHAGESDRRLLQEEQQEALLMLEAAAEKVQTPLQRMEHALHPWVTYAIIPLFALANAGVTIPGDFSKVFGDPIGLGIVFGLVLGKQIGVTAATWLVVKLGVSQLPAGVTWRLVYATGWVAGIGFTMSLFIAGLAFLQPAQLEAAKIGILAGSLTAGVVGYFLLRSAAAAAARES